MYVKRGGALTIFVLILTGFGQNFFLYVKAMGRKIREDGSRGAIEKPDGSLTHRFNDEERELVNT